MTVSKDVTGVVFTTQDMIYPAVVTVRYTQDIIGKSLSLSYKNVMLEIAAEQIEDIIKIELK